MNRFCSDVKLLGAFEAPKEGFSFLVNHNIDLLFLDIDMPDMNGFELLDKLENPDFEVVFTTAHDQFALKAIKICALDYLMKPVDEEELQLAVQKAMQKQGKGSVLKESLEHLLQQVKQNRLSNRVVFPTMEGLEFIDSENIIHCISDSNYTEVYFNNGSKMVVSKTLKDVEEISSQRFIFQSA